MLSVNSIDVSYGDLPVLTGVSLHVDEGEIVTILGSNGAGKTTFLRTISGFMRSPSGQITFLGRRIDGLPPYRIVELGISQVPTERELFPSMTVMENLEMGAYLKRDSHKKKNVLDLIFQLFPVLGERRKQLAGTLSGGEQQMLAVARGLMSSPRLLLLDEPSFGLAPKIVIELFKAIEHINENGVTILLVEQNVNHALSIADRGYVLENGKVRLEGGSQELLENPLVKEAYLGL